MDVHGYPWMSMDIHGCLWIFMDIHGKSMDIHGNPWISMEIHVMFKSSLKKKMAPTVKKKNSNKIAFFEVFGRFSGSGRVAKRPGRSLHAWGTFLEPGDQSKKKSKNRDFEKSI